MNSVQPRIRRFKSLLWLQSPAGSADAAEDAMDSPRQSSTTRYICVIPPRTHVQAQSQPDMVPRPGKGHRPCWLARCPRSGQLSRSCSAAPGAARQAGQAGDAPAGPLSAWTSAMTVVTKLFSAVVDARDLVVGKGTPARPPAAVDLAAIDDPRVLHIRYCL